jgi:hypothetical protein
MIISGKEIYDNATNQYIKEKIPAFGSGELEVLKKKVICDVSLFNQLFRLVFSVDQRLAWRSCWIIDIASEERPDLLSDKLSMIIEGFLQTENRSLKRHFTRILCRYQIPEEYLGSIVNRSFELLLPTEPIAVRVFAMQLLFNISLVVPELKHELISVIESLMEEECSKGFINRAEKLLRKLRS